MDQDANKILSDMDNATYICIKQGSTCYQDWKNKKII